MNDPLTYAFASLKRAAENGYPWSVSPYEAAALIAEVERLRAEVERRRDVYDLVGAVEHSAGQLAAHEDRGAWEERAAVVAYLHAEAWRMYEAGQDRPAWFVLCNRAEAIENSEHRREEKP